MNTTEYFENDVKIEIKALSCFYRFNTRSCELNKRLYDYTDSNEHRCFEIMQVEMPYLYANKKVAYETKQITFSFDKYNLRNKSIGLKGEA